MVARLRGVLSSTSDEDSSVVSLDRAESYWNVEVDVENFSLFSFVINVVEGNNLLIKLEKMNFVGSSCFDLLSVCSGSADHSDSSLGEVVGHR